MKIEQAKAIQKKIHDDLSNAFYAKKHTVGVTDKEQSDFDLEHAVIWGNLKTMITQAEDYIPPEVEAL